MLFKRVSFVLALAAVLCFVFAGAAFANFGPHGGYADDTDACAGCHRAHTSFSTVGWEDGLGTEHASALLVGSSTTMTFFCNACHGDNAPGASTNVVSGVFDSGPSTAGGAAPDGSTTLYRTDSTFGGALNGGGFESMPDPDASFAPTSTTSAHSMDADGPLWGAGSSLVIKQDLTCTDCHDPHGTSNFRLLKAAVNGETVGGYEADGLTPNPFVFGYGETGYPLPGAAENPTGGFLKHEDGAAQMAAYVPDYTGGTSIYHADSSGEKSLSVWCAACHTGYAARSAGESSTANYGIYEQDPNTGDLVGTQYRHRHPVDINVGVGVDNDPNLGLTEDVVQDDRLPLEKNNANNADWEADYLGCLTCHYAHGSASQMTGWAASHLESTTAGWIPVMDGVAGVNPAKAGVGLASVEGSALLRTDNRGVCERCHNK